METTASYYLSAGTCVFVKDFYEITLGNNIYVNGNFFNNYNNVSKSGGTADGGYYVYMGQNGGNITSVVSGSSDNQCKLLLSSSSSSGGSSGSSSSSAVGCAAGSTIYNPDKGSCNFSLAKGAVCIKISGNIAGWQVSSGDGRTCNVNGGTTTYYPESLGNNIQGPSTSPSSDGYTYINCTAGEVDWSVFSCW